MFKADSSQGNFSYVADEAAERVRMAYLNHGHFKAQVDAQRVPIAGRTAMYDVVVSVVEEGKQYRLGDLRIVDMKAFPEPQLRDLFPIQRGEIFSRQKVAKGLENLRKLYGSEGYINFTSLPNPVFDEALARVNLQVDTDEGRPFHWGNLHVEGMRAQDSEILLHTWEGLRGQVYGSDNHELDGFLRKFFYPVRRGTRLADCAIKKTDDVGGTVDIYLNLIWNPDITRRAADTDGLVR
jgi:outer membrane protein insertion porin family